MKTIEFDAQIYVRTEFEALHRYAGAPDEVEFLRYPHRHIFKVRVDFPVNDLNREKEFFIQKQKIDKFITSTINPRNAGSCEQIASKILLGFPDAIRCEVSEDGENGAILSRKIKRKI